MSFSQGASDTASAAYNLSSRMENENNQLKIVVAGLLSAIEDIKKVNKAAEKRITRLESKMKSCGKLFGGNTK
jgi:methyl-accepting chemotaxis protein